MCHMAVSSVAGWVTYHFWNKLARVELYVACATFTKLTTLVQVMKKPPIWELHDLSVWVDLHS